MAVLVKPDQSAVATTVLASSRTGAPTSHVVATAAADFAPRRDGTGRIEGTTTRVAVGGPCQLVLVTDPGGVPVDTTRSSAVGAYCFKRVAPGNYAVLIIDVAGAYRGKVLHTVVA